MFVFITLRDVCRKYSPILLIINKLFQFYVLCKLSTWCISQNSHKQLIINKLFQLLIKFSILNYPRDVCRNSSRDVCRKTQRDVCRTYLYIKKPINLLPILVIPKCV